MPGQKVLIMPWLALVAILGLLLSGCSSPPLVTETCVDMDRLALHIHQRLVIRGDGAPVTIPPDVGIGSQGCMRPIHTHDSTGTIHIEFNEVRDYTLGEFFQVWGYEFNSQSLLGRKGVVSLTVNGSQSQEFERLVLREGQMIVIDFRPAR